ncbi:hypothetical protein AALO_G00073970 [Alosa alosa]|uniref:LNR domain-containing protein n=1 Tax=Alosa alosa TaxID=278164 RepID=A0AAV6H2Q6_9TELE|nr:hypothetical protein AALO_G00073970 [Alosa alosa]
MRTIMWSSCQETCPLMTSCETTGGTPKAKTIVCTMGLKWYPDPESLHCIKGCEPFMGDNYCDAINNRAFCSYDGGDCCHSTVKTKKVIPFPMSCDLREDCACRDPRAQENSDGHRQRYLG